MALPEENINVHGDPLIPCSVSPMTGFFRDGYCATCEEDFGCHTICAVMTAEFLEFSKSRGNDLSTPRPTMDFPGLCPGDHWCLCAARWREAWEAGCAPQVKLAATHRRALEVVPLSVLEEFSIIDPQ